MTGADLLISSTTSTPRFRHTSNMFVKAILLLVGLSTVYTIKCYMCVGTDCSQTMDCRAWPQADNCFTFEAEGTMKKGCATKGTCSGGGGSGCGSAFSCCKGDLCNGTGPTGPTVLLLLVSSAIFTLFL